MFSIVLATISVVTHAFFNGMGLALGFTAVYSGVVIWYAQAQHKYANGKSWKEILTPPIVANWKQAYHERNNSSDYENEEQLPEVVNHLINSSSTI